MIYQTKAGGTWYYDTNEKGFGHGRHACQPEENTEQTARQAEAADKER